MILLTHAYLVPREKADAHARLARRLSGVMSTLGAQMDVVEQVGADFSETESPAGRFVQLVRFRDRRHLEQVRSAEKAHAEAQALIAELCELLDLPGQQMGGSYVPGTYVSVV